MRPVITCPADTIIDCTSLTTPAQTGSATASDSCDGAPVVTSSDVITPGSYPQGYTITRRWIATDACQNRDTCYQVITVQDTMRPVIICPADTIINCTSLTTPVQTGVATTSDSCDPGHLPIRLRDRRLSGRDSFGGSAYHLWQHYTAWTFHYVRFVRLWQFSAKLLLWDCFSS